MTEGRFWVWNISKWAKLEILQVDSDTLPGLKHGLKEGAWNLETFKSLKGQSSLLKESE